MSYDRWPPSPDTVPRRDAVPRRDTAPRPMRPQQAPPGYADPRDQDGYGPRATRLLARRRARRRRLQVLAVVLLAMLVGAVGFVVLRGTGESAPQTQPSVDTSAPGSPGASAGAQPAPAPQDTQVAQAVDPASVPQTGPGTFAYATGTGKTLGTAGTVRKFQVAVEKDIDQNANTFAAAVDRVLGDPRGWIAGKYRFQRVGSGASHDFVIYLATPATSEKMCAAGGLHTDKYTSCRLPGQVIINLARWLSGVPDYGAPLDVYRAYAINHEVGHQLGLYHEACPGRGQAAPVMQQQTLGLQGCVANAWPYVGGARVTGPPIP